MPNCNRLSAVIATGLLALSLTACGTLSKTKEPLPLPVVSVQPTLPPAELLRDCKIPAQGKLATNEDLVLWAKALRDGLITCNADKKALRAWADSILENTKTKESGK